MPLHKAPLEDLFLPLFSHWVRSNVMSWTPSRRHSRRLGDVFVRAFLFFSFLLLFPCLRWIRGKVKLGGLER
jgi:hypothetical protein